MERLTRKAPGGRYGLVEGKELGTVRNNRAVIDRLAAYEDTGLEPYVVAAGVDTIKKRFANHLELQMYRELGTHDHLLELVQAEKEGRLVVLPWAIGQTIYEADPEHGVVKHTLQNAIWNMASTAVDDAGNTWPDYWCSEDESLAHITRQEAEAELKRMK